MLSNIGNSILFINLAISLLVIHFAYIDLKKIQSSISARIYNTCLIQCTLIIICFFTLIAGFIISDFSISTVYQNSHSLKPLFYKISGTWGNHEGSLLLWVIILTIFSFFFLIKNKKHPKKI